MKIQDKKEPHLYYIFVISVLLLLLLIQISVSPLILLIFCLTVFILNFYKIDKNTRKLKQLYNRLELTNTELKNKNLELIRYNEKEKLENELILTNKELVYQNDANEKRANELIAANEELSAFTYIAGHDLQEPLRKTQLFISRIMEDKEQVLSEKNMDYFKKMEASSKRMQLLINDLLAYSRVNESDKELVAVDLNDIIDNILEDPALAQTIEETNTIITSAALPEVRGIPFQLEQLFINLINNAIKYSNPERTPVINIAHTVIKGAELSIEKANTDKDYYKITVTDNGIGFEQQFAEQIFMLFKRLHDKQKYSGSGIGLTICKKIADNHLGFITASGTPNQGAVFSLYIPVPGNSAHS